MRARVVLGGREGARVRVEPEAHERPARPWLTWTIIALNVAVFLGELAMSRSFFGIRQDVALLFGGNYAGATIGEMRVETLVTSCFLHWSVLHIVFNMVALRQVMPFLERFVGVGRTASLYLVSGIVGSVVSSLWGWFFQARVGAGASGAICGLIGGALIVAWRVQGWNSPLAKGMARWLGMVLLMGLLPQIDNAAHAGGAVGGALVALTWRRGPELPATRFANVTFFFVVLAASVARLVQQDLSNPWVTMTAGERLEAAAVAHDSGNCDGARDAITAARRVAPRSPDVLNAAQIIRRTCPREP